MAVMEKKQTNLALPLKGKHCQPECFEQQWNVYVTGTVK